MPRPKSDPPQPHTIPAIDPAAIEALSGTVYACVQALQLNRQDLSPLALKVAQHALERLLEKV